MRKNKGFSLVELLVVLAIMAILAGILAPMLIRYINKARLSRDIDTGKGIAQAIMIAVVDEKVKDNAVEHSDQPHAVANMDGGDFKKAVFDILSVTDVKGKSKRDVDGNVMESGSPQFYYKLDVSKNMVEVYYGGTSDDYQVYPIVGKKLLQ